VERPISYASRQLNKAELNYAASEQEILAVTWATKFYLCYLYGRHFVVRTDHYSLTYLHKFVDNNSRLMRWSLRLGEFQFPVEHRPGTSIRHVDAFSRHLQTVTVDKSLTKELLREEQKTDNFCNRIVVGKQNGKSEYFHDEEGFIYRRRKNGEHQLVVPKSLVRDVVALNHEPIFASHSGRKRSLETLCFRYYWPGMRKDVEIYVSKCDECQRRKQRGEYTAQLGEVIKPTTPLKLFLLTSVALTIALLGVTDLF